MKWVCMGEPNTWCASPPAPASLPNKPFWARFSTESQHDSMPTAAKAGCRGGGSPMPGAGSILTWAGPRVWLLFALMEDLQAPFQGNSGTKQFPKAVLLTNEGFQAFVLNPMLFSLQSAKKKSKRRRDDLKC